MTFSPLEICVRPERPADAEPIRHVNVMAFDGPVEADLVEALRTADSVALSAVALLGATRIGGNALTEEDLSRLHAGETYGGELVGHVMFTPAVLDGAKGKTPLLALGPVAVLPAEQRKGVGTMMISSCLEHLRSRGHIGVVVVGEHAFYRRFGFIQAERWGLENELGVPTDSFLALELTPGALGGRSGLVHYRPEFGAPQGTRDDAKRP